MKKIILTAALAVMAATVFAAGFGGGYGMMGEGYGQGYGPGYGGCGGPYYQNNPDGEQPQQPTVMSSEDATALVQKYLDENLKGYSIKDSEKFEVPRGNMYRFLLEDESGNQFLMVVNPFGYLRGPFLTNNVN